jgi:predicted dehydrogenase
MKRRANRRQFLRGSAAAGIGFWIAGSALAAENKPVAPNERLRIGIIGAGGRGRDNMGGVAGEPGVEIAALCDTNARNLAAAVHPKAKKFDDWRKLVEQRDVDAVIVSTPDHHHALAAVAAMKTGKHVYCEKPLAHSVYEARRVRDTYNEKKVATQMGTQIHATDNYRRVVELVQAGVIGPIHDVHVWCTRVGNAPGTTRPTEKVDVPKDLNWDLWLGPAPERPYNPSYMGGCTVWEQRWDFGNGCLGDMGSHLIDLPFWALKLRQPTTVEAEGANRSDECYPQWLIARWEHPATNERPGLKLTWYDGGKRPPNPAGHDLKDWGIGVLFEGEKGQLLADYGRWHLIPGDKFKDVKPNQSIKPSLGHYREWLEGCRHGTPTLCNFDYSGMLVEHNLLGVVAWRVGKKLTWDPDSMTAIGCPEASKFIRRAYRSGWTI